MIKARESLEDRYYLEEVEFGWERFTELTNSNVDEIYRRIDVKCKQSPGNYPFWKVLAQVIEMEILLYEQPIKSDGIAGYYTCNDLASEDNDRISLGFKSAEERMYSIIKRKYSDDMTTVYRLSNNWKRLDSNVKKNMVLRACKQQDDSLKGYDLSLAMATSNLILWNTVYKDRKINY